MDYVRVGGVCLLLMVLAAALPMEVLAQTPDAADSSGTGANANSAGGASSVISQSLLSGSSAQGETISAEKLAKRSSGLKPLASSKSTAASSSTPANTQSETASVPENTAKSTASETTAAADATSTTTTETAAASEAETSDKSASAESRTASQTATETATETASQTTEESARTETSTETATESTAIASESKAESSAATADSAAETATSSENLTATSSESNATAESVSQNESESTSESKSSESESSVDADNNTDRIWREGISPSTYTWTPQSFSGFFYDMKNDVGTERLTIKLQGDSRSIESGDLIYSTSAQDTEFEFDDWGNYQVMGFMADKYFAGYRINDLFSEDRSLINDNQLRKVLIDSDEESTITTGSVLPLEEGYELLIKQIDIDGNKVYLALAKDGEEVDSKVVSPDSLKSATYKYEVEISGEDTPIVMAHISNVFASTESALVTVDGLFQISDEYVSVEDGDDYDKMKVSSVSDQGVEMENDDSLTLRKGSTAKIFGNVGFEVADADEVRFAPVVQRTGTYDVRGSVINPSKTSDFTWTPYNFEGFYYDIDDDVGTESLQAKISGGTKIEEKDLIYETSPQSVKFEFSDWGRYDVIGFMADKYFAGYNNETKFTDEASSINEGELRKVLIDNDDSQTIASGSALSLEEGYELRIKQVDLNGNKVYFALAKDGEEVDSKVVTPSSDPGDKASNYMYKVDIGSEKDVPIITAHVESVFRSTESDLATVDGIFQISDSAESVEEGEVHGKMKVESLGDSGITMRNDGTISLSRDRTIEIMENLKIQVADNADRLMAPIATRTGEGKELTISVPAGVINKAVSMSTKSGTETLSGVQISVDGNSIGTTDITGSISYTPKSTGTFEVVAKRSGYDDAKGSLVVRTASEAATYAAVESANETLANQLTLNAPSEVAKGENFLITVVEGINQTPVEGADIFFNDESIGNTSDQGMLTYSANATGEYNLLAQKDGYKDATRKVLVTSSLKVLSLNVPEKASAGQDLKIAATIKNTGKEDDSRKFELKVNDSVVDSKNLTVKSGENATASFSYKPKDPGLYRFGLDDQTKTVNVEKAQNSNWLIALLIILLIACGAGFYLYRTGELDKLKKQLQGRM